MSKSVRQFRTQAIVLSRRDFGESDRLLTMFTPDYGKISAIAKGARKPQAKVSGHVELFCRTDVMIHKGRSIDILTQAELIDPYLGIREDLTRGAYANYVAELLERFTADEDINQTDLFVLLHQTFQRIADDDDPRLAARFYELQLLDLVGFRPELQECVVDRVPLVPIAHFFSNEEGGIVSQEAALRVGSPLVSIDFNTLKLLRHMQRNFKKYERVKSLTIHPDQHAHAERIMLGYISFLLESKLQSIDFIRRLRQLSPTSDMDG